LKGSNAIYNTIPKFQEWLIVNYVIKDAKGVLHGFYIFKGERLRDDYIIFCKPNICMVMQKRTWMTTFLFKESMAFFNKSIPSGISFNN
jgi:hypothetical protein